MIKTQDSYTIILINVHDKIKCITYNNLKKILYQLEESTLFYANSLLLCFYIFVELTQSQQDAENELE